MADTKNLYYPFAYHCQPVCTVAVYGSGSPVVVRGNLILRDYFTDSSMEKPDIDHTSANTRDVVFYETNKVIRERLGDIYNGRRELAEISLPELGRPYRLIFNNAELPSPRHDDQIKLLAYRAVEAHGVGVIMKRDSENGLCGLDEEEARRICEALNRNP